MSSRPPASRRTASYDDVGSGWFSKALVVLAAVTLAVVAAMAAEIFLHTRDLQRSVAATSAIADANVRTVTQTQRELLRLEVAVLGPTASRTRDIDLEVALAEQRTQEAALPYHARALSDPELLDAATAARRQWSDVVRPAVERFRDSGTAADRRVARTALQDLELRYNDISRVAADTRKTIAGEAGLTARELAGHSQNLVVVLGASLVAGVATLLGLLATSRRLRAARRRHQRDLVALNAGLSDLAEVVRTTDTPVARVHHPLRVQWVNVALARLLDDSPENVVGRTIADLGATDLGLADDVDLATAAARGRAFEGELRLHAGGEAAAEHGDVHLTFIATPARDVTGLLTGWNVVANDISDRVARRLLLEQAREDAERLADEKSRFLATMSHEIRTPLNAVIGLQEVLAHSPLDAAQTAHLQQARDSARHLLDLVNDVLDFSALDAGRLENIPGECDLPACLGGLTDLFSHDAASRGLTLDTVIDDAVPAMLLLDSSLARRVMVNLLGNAVKYTEHGGVRVEASWRPGTSPEGPEGVLRLRVIDTGPGIDPAEADALFEPFARSRSTRDRTSGTGLGLWICRHVTDLLGGRITLEPGASGGTVATVDLPTAALDTATATREVVVPAPEPVAEPAAGTGLRVLLADDDDVNRLVLRSLLGRLGVEPVVAAGGEEASALLLAGGIDIALLDQRMPDLDGTEVAARARAAGTTTRLVVVTADALPGDRERLLAAGMDDYLAKPVTLEALRAALERAALTVTA